MMRLNVARAFLASALLVGCADAGFEGTGGEDVEPTIEITAPARGTISDGTAITVSGHVSDDGPVTISVNGQTVAANSDGSFSTSITVPAGMAIIETHAVDKTNHDARDVRAVLAGATSATDGSVPSQIAARVGTPAITAIANTIANSAEGIDFTSIAKQANPVYNNGGCLGAVVNITSVSIGGITASLRPTNALVTDVSLDNVVVKAHADYKFSCIGGSTTITVTSTHAKVHGDLGVNVEGMNIKTSLSGATVNLEGFGFDVGGLPGAVEDLVKGQVRSAVEDALVKAVKDKVPGFANTALSGLIAKPVSTELLGHAMSFGISPADVQISNDGLFVALDATVNVEGGEGGMFVPTSAQVTPALLADSGDLGIALANDAVNQLFAGMWATGSLEQSLDISTVGPLAAILDNDIKTLDVHLSLPPNVTTIGNELSLAIGDLIITGKDASGAEVQTIALTLTTSLSAQPTQSGVMQLVTGTPTVKAQILAQSAAVDRKLTSLQIEGIVSGAWGLVSGMADEALAKIPMPSLAGMSFQAPRIAGKDGFVVAQISMQ